MWVRTPDIAETEDLAFVFAPSITLLCARWIRIHPQREDLPPQLPLENLDYTFPRLQTLQVPKIPPNPSYGW